MKILMVCLGNICRSPLAEGILQAKAIENNLNWEVESAGTGGWHIGNAPDGRSIDVAQKYGLDISKQQARQFKGYDLEVFDLIYAMDTANRIDILKQVNSPEEEAKVKLILNELNPEKNESVPDPYYDDNGFEEVYTMLDQACQIIIEKHLKAQ